MSTIEYDSTKGSSNIVCLTVQCIVNMLSRTALKFRRIMFCKGRGEPLQGYHFIFLVLVILGLMNIAFWVGFATANLKNQYENMKNRFKERNVDIRDDVEALNPNNRLSGKFYREIKFDSVKEVDEDIGKNSEDIERLKQLKEEAQKKIENEDLQNLENDEEKKVAELNRIEENLKNFEEDERKRQNEEPELVKIDESQRNPENERNGELLQSNVDVKQRNSEIENQQNQIEKLERRENIQSSSKVEQAKRIQNQLNEDAKQRIQKAASFTRHSDEVLRQMPIISMDDLEENRTTAMVVVFVISSPHSFDQRQAIRETWWTKCRGPQAVCYFATDGFIEESMYDRLMDEHKKYKDILFLPTDEGLNSGLRLFFLLQWAQSKYKPSFFLRIDDDYFLCIERLLNELPHRRSKALVWGYWHCENTSAVYVDESFLLLSFDLVDMILSWDEKKLLCHPYGDQQLALWLTQHSVQFFGFHDKRLAYNPTTSDFNTLKNSTTKLCDVRLGVREIYPTEMKTFWSNGNDGQKPFSNMVPVYPNVCRHQPRLSWDSAQPNHRYKPELCIKNPRWMGK